jgi:SAM-dependent methyltransferase
MKKCLACAHAFESTSWSCPICSWRPELLDGHPSFSAELAEDNEGFSPEYFADLASCEIGHFWFESRNRLLMWALNQYFPTMRSGLEIGCGTGFVLEALVERFAQATLAGSEVFREGLTFAAQRVPSAELFQMDARKIPFRNEFDVIGAFDVLEHIEEDEEVLREMYGAIKPGGGIILTVPQHQWLCSDTDLYSFHKRRYSRRELKSKVESAGFRVVHATSFVSVLLPVLMISRYRFKDAGTFRSEVETNINPVVNRVLMAALTLERSLIKWGLSLPAGGSLLLVAKKIGGDSKAHDTEMVKSA